MLVALVLAAGASRRFGDRDKRRALLSGRPLLGHALDRAREAEAVRVVLVTDRRLAWVERDIVQVRARDARTGMGASLAAGLRALRPIERTVLVFLADVPFARGPKGLHLKAGVDAARPVYRGVPGHPLLVRTTVAKALVRPGERGIAGAIAKDRLRILRGRPGNILDIDTRSTLARLRYRIAGAGGELRLQNRELGCFCKPHSGSRPPRR